MALRLADFFRRQFYPTIQAKIRATDRRHAREAFSMFLTVVGQDATLAALTNENYFAFKKHLTATGLKTRRQAAARRTIVALWTFAHRLGVAGPPVYDPPRRKRQPGPVPLRRVERWSSGREIVLPKPEKGTLRHFYRVVYRPERMLVASEDHVKGYKTLFVTLWRWRGRDVRLDELSDPFAAKFFMWLLDNGRSNESVNRYRRYLFPLWKLATAQGVVRGYPTIPKLKVVRNAPDSWTVEQLESLLEAARIYRGDARLADFPTLRYGDVMRAMILVVFYTAIRRRSAVELRREDVELATARLTVRGGSIKNGQGKRFRIPPTAVEALRLIWEPQRTLMFPMSRSHAGKQFKRIFMLTGLQPSVHKLGHFHKVRRTAATHACVVGGVKEASQLLGHSSEYVTNLYIDPAALPDNAAGLRLPLVGMALRSQELADARDLLSAGKPHLAAMAARIVLERAFKSLAERTGKDMEGRGVAAMAQSLSARGHLAKEAAQQVSIVLRTANAAAHGDPVDAGAVEDLIRVAEQFAGDAI